MKLVPLSRGLFAKVDDKDFDDLSQFNWTIKTSSKENVLYAKRFSIKDGKHTTELMHRRIMGAVKGIEVDHIDHDGLNNQRMNLRASTFTENRRNRRRQKNHSQKFQGVHRSGKKWCAKIWSNGETLWLGTFNSEIEAAEAWNEKASALRGPFAHLNRIHKGFQPVTEDE